jgi:hypothetical protein
MSPIIDNLSRPQWPLSHPFPPPNWRFWKSMCAWIMVISIPPSISKSTNLQQYLYTSSCYSSFTKCSNPFTLPIQSSVSAVTLMISTPTPLTHPEITPPWLSAKKFPLKRVYSSYHQRRSPQEDCIYQYI